MSRRGVTLLGIAGLLCVILLNFFILFLNQSQFTLGASRIQTESFSEVVSSARGPADQTQNSGVLNLSVETSPTLVGTTYPGTTLSHEEPSVNADLHRHLNQVLDGCGQVCNTSILGKRGLFFDQISKKFDCRSLWTNSAIDKSRPGGPAPSLPETWRQFYSYNGRVRIVNKRLVNQQYLDAQAKSPVWQKSQIDVWSKDCAEGHLEGNYGIKATKAVFEGLRRMPSLSGGHVLVIGSENPWIEACILGAGARHVTTLEYGSIISEHPKISTMTPWHARAAYTNGTLPLFDSIVTYSSVEHSGLGRYGDQLNPWGDLQTIARAWCICKPDGYLLLGVMESPQDRECDSDEIVMRPCSFCAHIPIAQDTER